ncbi:zinc-binding dehydrogenase [Streptomyces sp. NPDC005438]|uniref:zinc-binding dehydrogenase n=1 Tax=Streptomyces sp. NPDC005438 TaxID=3156880 RepID=UPI0033A3455E
MSTTMRGWVLTRHGGPEALRFEELPVPTPGPGRLLVRVTAAALNNTDIWTRTGAYGLPGDPEARAGWRGAIDFPRVQGGDAAGVVERVGPGVDPALVGRRVLVDPAFYQDDAPEAHPVGLLGSEADGTFAEYVLVRAERAHDVHTSPLTDEELACLPVAYGTATGMLERAAVGAGETVLVTGASGGVGLALVQLATARGARVVAVTSAAKAQTVRDAGAVAVIDRAGGAEAVARQAPEELDAVADVTAGELVPALLPRLREGGRWVVAGAVAGPVVTLDLRRLYLRNIALLGSSMHTPAHFARLAEDARRGLVRPVVAARFPLPQLPAAQEEFLHHGHAGKIVLVPST